MEPLEEDSEVGLTAVPAARPDRASAPKPFHVVSRLWPLAALAFTTVTLAASAIRVVASSISDDSSLGLTVPAASASDDTKPNDNPPPDHELDCSEASTQPGDDVAVPRPITPGRQVQAPCPSSSLMPKSDRTPLPPISGGPSKTSDGNSVGSPPPTLPISAPTKSESKRVLVRDGDGQPMVARIHGQDGDRVAVMLPDGRIGWPDGLVYTDRPFVPLKIEEMKPQLVGEFKGFKTIETRHYLLLYRGTEKFALASSALLEDLYAKLSGALNKRGVPVHEAEFPLVAVIFETEDEFRRHKKVATDVQAYYDIISNRIFLYERSTRDQSAPEVSALRKPQTVAHEGTHQILQNIGVQPRLSGWPLWLVEGLAEYCASPRLGKNGVPQWAGLGQVNLPHIATIRDLDDPLSTKVAGANVPAIVRDPGTPLVEYLVTRAELNPSDYALAWALTYYLAIKRADDFLDFVREMSQIPPLERRSPADHLRSFKAAFGDNLVKLDLAVLGHLRKLKQIDALPYYAVMFEQPVQGGRVHRAAMVSQSPLIIRQWLENNTSPRGAEPRWDILPHPSRARAMITAEQWIVNH
jgi:hypothetical protein